MDILLPSACIACGTGTAESPLSICAGCKNDIVSSPAPPVLSSRYIEEIHSWRAYEGAVKECVLSMKFGNDRSCVILFEELFDPVPDRLGASSEIFDLIVPVPLHPARQRIRGYNQSQLLASVLASKISIPVSSRLLLKTKPTKPQKGLSKDRRMGNIRGSFCSPDGTALFNKTVLLVDDVITTGATLDTCAKELLRAGARRVYGFVLARTL